MWPRLSLSNPTKMPIKKGAKRPPRPKPTITYGNALKTIEQLENDGQPWAIARFPVRARFVEGEIGYCYEILLFQTLSREEPNDIFTMNRETFREVLRLYNLQCQYKTRSYGEVYGRDTRLKDTYKLYARTEEKMKNTLKAIRQKQYDLTDAASRSFDPTEKERLRSERDKKRKEAEDYEKKIKQFHKRFCEENNIIIYTF